MGVDYRAKLVVGVDYKTMAGVYDTKETELDFGDWCEDECIDRVSLYYDASEDDCVYGHVVDATGDYSYSEVELSELSEKVAVAKEAFKDDYGLDAKLLLCTNGS